jgi:hypothetical protein
MQLGNITALIDMPLDISEDLYPQKTQCLQLFALSLFSLSLNGSTGIPNSWQKLLFSFLSLSLPQQ